MSSSARSSAESPAPASDEAPRVLVVDDNRDAADSLVDLLLATGYQAEAAYDARGALELAPRLRPHVAVVDIGLPVMDGYELARRLRERRDAPALLALTGYGLETDRERSAAAGFAAHLVKPVDLDRLEHTLRALLEQRRAAGGAMEPEPRPDAGPTDQ